jgi:hypothetical protein
MYGPAKGNLLKLCPSATTLRLEAGIRRRDGHYRWVTRVTVGNYAVHAPGKVP